VPGGPDQQHTLLESGPNSCEGRIGVLEEINDLSEFESLAPLNAGHITKVTWSGGSI